MYKTLSHEWFEEIWNKGDAAAAHRLMAPEARIHNLAQDGNDSVGVAAFLDFFENSGEHSRTLGLMFTRLQARTILSPGAGHSRRRTREMGSDSLRPIGRSHSKE